MKHQYIVIIDMITQAKLAKYTKCLTVESLKTTDILPKSPRLAFDMWYRSAYFCTGSNLAPIMIELLSENQ